MKTPWAAAAVMIVAPALGAERWFQVSSDPAYTGWRRQIQAMVDHGDGAIPQHNQVCVVGWTDGGRGSQAYVYWPSGDTLITWWPDRYDTDSLLHSTHRLDLKRDVVATQADIGTSTYLVDRAWVSDVASHCARYGQTVDVIRHRDVSHG